MVINNCEFRDVYREITANGSRVFSQAYKKRRAPRALAQGARESSGALLSRARGPGTIGEGRLDFRVRNGNGYDPLSRTAETNTSAVG